MKTYSVKEIREITGLTWKQLYEYKIGILNVLMVTSKTTSVFSISISC